MSIEIGGFYYLKRLTVYHQCRVKSLHEFQDTAKVEYFASGEPLICRQSELLTEEQYQNVLKQRRIDQLPKIHARLIALWGNGPEKPTEAARRRFVASLASKLGCSASGLGRTLAMLGRYGLIKYDNEPLAINKPNIG